MRSRYTLRLDGEAAREMRYNLVQKKKTALEENAASALHKVQIAATKNLMAEVQKRPLPASRPPVIPYVSSNPTSLKQSARARNRLTCERWPVHVPQ